MNRFGPRFPRRDHHIDENNVLGEILEDIECLDSADVDNENLDILNDDTFGDFGDSHWDPTETFMEAERLKNVTKPKPRRTSTELEKFSDFDFFLRKFDEVIRPKKDLNRRKKDRRAVEPISEVTSEPEERVWEEDLKQLRELAMFEITSDHIDLLSEKKVKLCKRFQVLSRTIERHVRCVDRNDRTVELEYFMTPGEFDKILRIQLAQVSKDPKLQSYTGKWNLYHLGVKKPKKLDQLDSLTEDTGSATGEEDTTSNEFEQSSSKEDASSCASSATEDYPSSAAEDSCSWMEENPEQLQSTEDPFPENKKKIEKKENKKKKKLKKKEERENKIRSNRFGRVSAASIRHGRRLIYLGGDASGSPIPSELEKMDPEMDLKVDLEKEVRSRIESCYETLYVLCDVEHEIEKCPMNHVSALDKMQRDRDDYLNELFNMLTGDPELFTGLLALNKGRNLTTRIGRKLGLEQKLQLLCTVLGCLDQFYEICHDVDVALENEQSLASFVELATNPHNLKSLVAFEGSGLGCDTTSEGSRLQNILFMHSSYTRMFLFLVEGITLTGHMFLLKGKDGRHTALQRCCNILISAQKNYRGFEKVLTTRGGIMFTNIFFHRIRDNAGTVDQNSIDVLLHYTLEISERIESNQADWNSLASNIVKMF
ncbi:hypothetical protein MACJ_002873 [Theileria orientalis]|uniref:Uncharacterized protein n=1 Tax=Theileria orientalis TaxID=68886 RepID=A0A976M6P7_THEOR|nr:hypothetical protein MACJ_002873 [Theileria orientalis]